jgi:cytochrome c oxidase assembly factor CtaG
METKFMLTMLLYVAALIAYIKAYLLNITTAKSDLLVSGCIAVALLTGCFRLYFYVLRERDIARMRKIKDNEEIRDIAYNRKIKEQNEEDISRNFN